MQEEQPVARGGISAKAKLRSATCRRSQNGSAMLPSDALRVVGRAAINDDHLMRLGELCKTER
jgi:hypothetical protein